MTSPTPDLDRFATAMSPADQRRWRAAATLAELGELTALWLEGRLASQPGYVPECGPDDETRELVPVLAAVNRAGWRTYSSQPGLAPQRGYDGAVWAQRAGVSGLAEPALADRIATAAKAAGLLVLRRAGVARRRIHPGLVVTTRAGKPCTRFGSHLSLQDLYDLHPECSDNALRVLARAVQLTVVDPEWGRNHVEWPLLMDLFA